MNIFVCSTTSSNMQQLFPLASPFRDQRRRFEQGTDNDATLPNDFTVRFRLQGATECNVIKTSKNLILSLQKQFVNISTNQ